MLDLLDHASGLLIAIVGGIFTYFYNRRQQDLVAQRDRESERLQLLEATEKMIPHLQGATKEVALVALSNLAGSTKLILSLAELYPGRAATVACLEILQELRSEHTSEPSAFDLIKRPLFYSLYSAAAQVEALGVIELLTERLEREELLHILTRTDFQGRTVVMNAAKYNRGHNISDFVQLGAPLTATDIVNETALHHAVRYGNRSAIKVLLNLAQQLPAEERTEFLNKKARRSWTALDLAISNLRKPPDPTRLEHYRATVRRLELAGVESGAWWGKTEPVEREASTQSRNP